MHSAAIKLPPRYRTVARSFARSSGIGRTPLAPFERARNDVRHAQAKMQLISTLALAASASALVAPVAPKASTALKGATLDDQLKKIPGVSPLKNAPADYGFDPLGFAKVSYPRFGLPEDELLRTNNLRDAELRHGRLAMLAAAAWPIQELAHPSLAKLAGAPELLSDGRSPSILNGGLVAGPVPAFLLATAAAIGYLDVQAEAKKAEYPAEDWIPGLGAVSLKMP